MALQLQDIVTDDVKECENSNALLPSDAPVHGWYRFVLSFPPHLVRRYLDAFGLGRGDTVLDPFCGTGTTLVECLKHGISSLGVEAHPVAHLAASVKTNWDMDAGRLAERLREIVAKAEAVYLKEKLDRLSLLPSMLHEEPESQLWGMAVDAIKLIPKGFLSPKPMRRLVVLNRVIEDLTARLNLDACNFFKLALAHVIANGAGNFAFGPEIYRTKPQEDYDVLGHFSVHARRMIDDIRSVRLLGSQASAHVFRGDARTLQDVKNDSCDAVITSPPYPNEKDYTRIMRVESVLLGLIGDKKDLRSVKENLLRSNTRNIFKDDDDREWVVDNKRIQDICATIERRREALGKTSGFERLYHKVVAHYFGGMLRHFHALKSKLKRGGRCAYVVGDQLSFLRVPVPTAAILAELAESAGFRQTGCDLWRTRLGTKSGTRVREEILLLERT